MRKKCYTAAAVLLYILLLSGAWSFDVTRLIDGRLLFQLLVGSILLMLPFIQKNADLKEILSVFGKKALEAGYIQTFLLLFIRLSEETGYEGILADVAMNFRPVLYGFFLFLLFGQQEEIESGTEKEGLTVSEPENLSDAYETFRQAGLTKRETEIAILICKGCSNKEISEEFVISETTVKKHVSNIFEKTGVKKREELKEFLQRNKYDSK